MKYIGITQRIDYITSYNEYRDALDISWYNFLTRLNFIPVPIPNIEPNYFIKFKKFIKLDGIILSGGNNHKDYERTHKKKLAIRDSMENKIITYGIKHNLPILGVCRGMQVINSYFGGSLVKVKNTSKKHKLLIQNNHFKLPKMVNSFHKWGLDKSSISTDLISLANDESSLIEAFKHKKKKILGIMWHPERNKTNNLDLKLFRDFFNG